MTVCSVHVEVALGFDVVDYSIRARLVARARCHPRELAKKVLSLVAVAHPRTGWALLAVDRVAVRI